MKPNPNVIVGLEKADDAGVYKLSEDTAIIQTVDFITPIVDDPYSFGMIAAANALSDVYAMGGRPLTTMNVVCFPEDKLEIDVLSRILAGALSKVEEAGAVVVGGHSIKDAEIKFGLSVTGAVHPQKVITNGGAKVGDRLILTKPLGTGILNTALRAEMLEASAIETLTTQMATLNKAASEVMVSVGANACTDVTGFGLIGHLCEMALASNVSVELETGQVPIMDGAEKLARMGLIPAGMYDNLDFREGMVEQKGELPTWKLDAFYDPQTSGGLIIAAPPEKAEEMLAKIKDSGVKLAAIIGTIVDGTPSKIILR